MSNLILNAQDVVKRYASRAETLHILRGAALCAEEGASVAITGRSGCGKSTLLNILGGLDRCDSGSVRIAGAEITGLSEQGLAAFRRDTVGFIFQFHYLLKDFTALENVMLPAYMAGLKKKAALEKARSLLEDLKLGSRLRHLPFQLSGGERQRVAVARALINDPALILADEPTGSLDADNSALVAELLYRAAGERGKTLVVVTHDENVASRARERYTLEGGVLIAAAAGPGGGGGAP
ncbi:MAG: ABC transporter ATP-binding protein [Spirochaetaceae bacterium]|jgi:lipoprotein-releasing system ATP-binding protein|nr:ABC transporter ATP-binding protein [Spirochaetaceae bacterium]